LTNLLLRHFGLLYAVVNPQNGDCGLSGELQLRSMMANDVSSAQMDLRHLALESLLTLRVQSLDFATDSRSHEAHGNFLAALERQLFEQIAQRICKSSMKEESSPSSKEVLRRLGLRSTLVLGAAESLSRPKKVQNAAKVEHVSLEDPDEEELRQELKTLQQLEELLLTSTPSDWLLSFLAQALQFSSAHFLQLGSAPSCLPLSSCLEAWIQQHCWM